MAITALSVQFLRLLLTIGINYKNALNNLIL